MIVPTLWIRQLRLRQVKSFAQDYTVNNQEICASNPGLYMPDFVFFSIICFPRNWYD